MVFSSELAALVGGDEYELEAKEIADDVGVRKDGLAKEFPFFYNKEYPIP